MQPKACDMKKIKIKITTYSIDVRYLLSTWRYILQVKIVMSLKTSCRTNILNIMNTGYTKPSNQTGIPFWK